MAITKKTSELVLERFGKVGKITINGAIGWSYFGIDYAGFKSKLEGLGQIDLLEVYINSPGGIVTDGNAMVNLMREQSAIVHTYNLGMAASMGSVVLFSGDKVFIPDNSMTMIHKPLCCAIGNADDMRKRAKELDKFEKAITAVYMKHFKGSEEEFSDVMASETWWTADEMEDKFENVTIIKTADDDKTVDLVDPIEIFGDPEHKDKLLDRFKNSMSNIRKSKKSTGTSNEEADMTPEERDQLKKEMVEDMTPSLVEAVVKAMKEEPKPIKQESALGIEFEGELDDIEAVEAHAKKVQLAEIKASADMSTSAGVMAYHKALKEFKNAEVEPQPASNAVPAKERVIPVDGHSDEACTKAADDMASHIN